MLNSFKNKLTTALNMGQPPLKMAMALGLGVVAGLSPFLGLHIILAVLAAKAFRLPVLLSFLGTNISNPLTIPFYYHFAVKFGNYLLQRPSHILFDWRNISLQSFMDAGEELLIPFLFGTSVIAPIGGLLACLIVYPIFRYIISIRQKRQKQKY